jgi:type III secretory pathway lipoprotein EscJ
MKTIIKYAIVIAFILLCLTGCMVFWTDQVFIVTAFKVVDANDLALLVDPNITSIKSGQTETKNDKIKIINPAVGIIETK